MPLSFVFFNREKRRRKKRGYDNMDVCVVNITRVYIK
jgi:hypothetical protein